MAGVAALASQVTGRPVRRVVLSDEEYVAGLVGHGLPEARARMLAGMFAASRHGDFGPADPALARLIGRPATPLADLLKAAITAPESRSQ
jgi:NAD(P)H dehydrogenase (quinone)